MAVDKDQYKALHDYHKTQYDNEIVRGQKLEDKSAKYLTAQIQISSATHL